MQTCTRRIEWDMGHRVPDHDGKCRDLHGHRYAAEITVQGVPQADGMIVDFGVVKALVGGWVDEHLDHNVAYCIGDELMKVLEDNCIQWKRRQWFSMPKPPTAEHLAELLFRKAEELLPKTLRVLHVRVYETPNCWADFAG